MDSLPFMKAFLNSFNSTAKIKGASVLDYGCGNGDGANLFKQLGAKRVVALDIVRHPELKLNGGIEFINAATSVNFGHFDLVWSHHVIEHVHNPIEYLRICYAMLQPAGELWLTCPNMAKFTTFSPEHIHNFMLPNLTASLQLADFGTDFMAWWTTGQLRIRVAACGKPTFPDPMLEIMTAEGRINAKDLPERHRW